MENFQFIEYHRKRDFSKKVNATFEYIKQNFKSLFKSILFIAGPPMLIGSLLIGSFMGDFMNMFQQMATDPVAMQEKMTSMSFWGQFVLMMICITVALVISLSTINNYLLLYEEKKSNVIEVSEVWERVRGTLLMYFGTVLMFLLLLIVFYLIIVVVVVGLVAASGGGAGAAALSGLLFFVLFLGFFYVTVAISLTFIIRTYEKKGFFAAVGRSFKLVYGKWWSTFGLVFILYLVMMIISYIPMIPFYVVFFINSLHSINSQSIQAPSASMQVWTTLSFVLYYLCQMLLSALPNVGIAFQYFNLVELKESRGLMADIETLGKPVETERPEETF
ncbi:MAG: hypothetical protein DI538_02325 [Azospira oryzae]|jgi:hypothetical protein|nr:MAG: hypothetical protein DI538_02325 [Azospira oryzae]